MAGFIIGEVKMSSKQLMKDTFEVFMVEMEKFESGNKSAGTRARKSLSEMTKLCKVLRQEIQQQKNSDK